MKILIEDTHHNSVRNRGHFVYNILIGKKTKKIVCASSRTFSMEFRNVDFSKIQTSPNGSRLRRNDSTFFFFIRFSSRSGRGEKKKILRPVDYDRVVIIGDLNLRRPRRKLVVTSCGRFRNELGRGVSRDVV